MYGCCRYILQDIVCAEHLWCLSCDVFYGCENVFKALRRVETGGYEVVDNISGPCVDYCEDVVIALS